MPNFTEPKRRLLDALMTSPTITEAAEKAQISRRSAQYYVKDKTFLAELNRRRAEASANALRLMQGKQAIAAEQLALIIESEGTPASVRIQAIQALFAISANLATTVDFAQRLAALEADAAEETDTPSKGAAYLGD